MLCTLSTSCVIISKFTLGVVCALIFESELGIPDGNFVREFFIGVRRLLQSNASYRCFLKDHQENLYNLCPLKERDSLES